MLKLEELHMDDCIETIIKFYANMVYRLAFARMGTSSDADDVFQEVFMRYIKKQPVFENEEHRKAWLIRVTINCSNKVWNSAWRRKTEVLSETIAFEMKDDIDLYNELQKLPKKYRDVIHLFYYEDMSLEQISRVLKRKNSTVRTQLTRGRALLKTMLKGDYDV